MKPALQQRLLQEVSYGQILLDERGRVVLWNRWIEDRSRRAREKVTGLGLEEVFPGRTLSARLLREIRHALAPGHAPGRTRSFAPFALPLRDTEGGSGWLKHSLSVVALRVGPRRYCLLEIKDLSEATTRERLLRQRTRELRQEREALERANERLASKNRELDEFVYQVSHDLQEPLRKIRSFSDLLRLDLGEDLPEDAATDLEFLCDASTRMSRLVSDLLELSKAGNAAMRWEPLSVRGLAEDALVNLSARVEDVGAEIRFDGLPEAHGDPRLLTQLFQNLLGNALKFVDADTPRVTLTHARIDGEDVFGVQDNGIGIDAAHARSIFTPFKRLHSRTEFEGTGIGLSICHKVVQRHGGRIWVESEKGAGAHFRFTLGAEAPPGVQAVDGAAETRRAA